MTQAPGPKDEYLDASENMRLYANLRFVQLTLFAAISAAILSVLFSKNSLHTVAASSLLKTGGLLTVIVFWIMEERAADFFHHFKRRAIAECVNRFGTIFSRI